MPMQTTRECPRCGTERTFYLVASTELHLGRKTKWLCEECDYKVVTIDGDVDSTAGRAEA
jgi:transposase-like protein